MIRKFIVTLLTDMIRIFLHCERFSRSSLAVGEYCGVVALQKTLDERVGDLVIDLSGVGGGIVTSDA